MHKMAFAKWSKYLFNCCCCSEMKWQYWVPEWQVKSNIIVKECPSEHNLQGKFWYDFFWVAILSSFLLWSLVPNGFSTGFPVTHVPRQAHQATRESRARCMYFAQSKTAVHDRWAPSPADGGPEASRVLRRRWGFKQEHPNLETQVKKAFMS